jgi:hypothetical protein
VRISQDDPIYGHYPKVERQRIAALIRRAQHLRERVEQQSTRDLSWDRGELAALQWVLGVLANAGKGANGIPEDQELV